MLIDQASVGRLTLLGCDLLQRAEAGAVVGPPSTGASRQRPGARAWLVGSTSQDRLAGLGVRPAGRRAGCAGLRARRRLAGSMTRDRASSGLSFARERRRRCPERRGGGLALAARGRRRAISWPSLTQAVRGRPRDRGRGAEPARGSAPCSRSPATSAPGPGSRRLRPAGSSPASGRGRRQGELRSALGHLAGPSVVDIDARPPAT